MARVGESREGLPRASRNFKPACRYVWLFVCIGQGLADGGWGRGLSIPFFIVDQCT